MHRLGKLSTRMPCGRPKASLPCTLSYPSLPSNEHPPDDLAMSSNDGPSGSRNLFRRRRGRNQEQNSTPKSNLSPDPDIILPRATRYAVDVSSYSSHRPVFILAHHVRLTSPELREGSRNTFRPKRRKQSFNPALRAQTLTPDLATSAPLRQPTTSLGA